MVGKVLNNICGTPDGEIRQVFLIISKCPDEKSAVYVTDRIRQ